MEKEKVVDDKHDHKLRVWMRVWFMKYMMAFPEKQQKIPTVEEHKEWYDKNLKFQVDVNNYNRIASNLDKLGHSVKHSGRRGRRHSKHRSPRSRSAPPSAPSGGFRYGMKIPRRRTLRSKLKTQRLKSVKKKRKRKGKKSRKKRRRKKTAKNKK